MTAVPMKEASTIREAFTAVAEADLIAAAAVTAAMVPVAAVAGPAATVDYQVRGYGQ